MIAALLLFVASAVAAPVSPAKPQWLKMYSTIPYRETWTGELAVKKLDAALPKIVAAIEKDGGRLTQPLANFIGSSTEQQLSLIVPLSRSKALLKALRKLGKTAEPAVRPHAPRVPVEEVRGKLTTLTQEKREKWGALAQTPAAAALVDEMIEHLANAEAAARPMNEEVLWNMTVKESR